MPSRLFFFLFLSILFTSTILATPTSLDLNPTKENPAGQDIYPHIYTLKIRDSAGSHDYFPKLINFIAAQPSTTDFIPFPLWNHRFREPETKDIKGDIAILSYGVIRWLDLLLALSTVREVLSGDLLVRVQSISIRLKEGEGQELALVSLVH